MLDKTMEIAVKLHRQMWSDMQRDLGDCPSFYDRTIYKYQWCDKHIGSNLIFNDCFLCEYVEEMFPYEDCAKVCPIKWTGDDCCGEEGWEAMPISKLLALPERDLNEVN